MRALAITVFAAAAVLASVTFARARLEDGRPQIAPDPRPSANPPGASDPTDLDAIRRAGL